MSTLSRLECVDKNGDVVGVIPRFREVSWLYELGQDGGGTLTVDALDDAVRATIRETDMVRVVVDNVIRAGIVLRNESLRGADRPELEVSGPGPKGLLSEALVYPPGGLNPLLDTWTRRLDWTEPYMDSSRISGVIQDFGVVTDPTGSSQWDPAEWADSNARWIWADDGKVCYLALDFTTATTQQVRLESSVDDEADVYLDGVELLSMRGEGRHQETMQSEAFTLPSGSHRLAIRAEDKGGNARGVIASLMGTLADGQPDPGNVLARTDTSGAWVGVGDPSRVPGMLPGEIVNLLVDEAQARGAVQSVTVDMTDTEQSPVGSGVSWTTEYALNVQIGESVSQVLDRLHELGPDIWVTGDPMVQAVERKGTDQSRSVFIRVGRDVTDLRHTATRTDGNAVLAQSQTGSWSEHTHSSTGDPLIGRREWFLRAGSVDDDRAASDLVNAAFTSHALRVVESTVSFIESEDSEPHVAFELGDDVSVPSYDFPQDVMSARVLAIGGRVRREDTRVRWHVETQETQ